GVAVMRQEAVATAHDEAAPVRLGIGQTEQQFLNLRQNVVGVGQPAGLLRLLAGVAIEQRTNRNPNGQCQDKSGDDFPVECLFHRSPSAAADFAGTRTTVFDGAAKFDAQPGKLFETGAKVKVNEQKNSRAFVA